MTLMESASASMSGKLYDAGLDRNQLALFGALLGGIMVVWWGVYYFVVQGSAANPRFAMSAVKTRDDDTDIELEDVPEIA